MMIRSERNFMLFGLSETQRSWQGLRLLMGVYIGSLLFAAILAPWLYWLVQALHAVAPQTFEYLAHKGFEDYFDRLRWLPVLIVLPWLFIRCRLYSAKDIGLSWNRQTRGLLRRWFILGALLLLLIVGTQFYFTDTFFHKDLSWGTVIAIALKALAGALLVSLLEETVFRGLILRLFYTATGPFLGIILCSMFFAYAHYKMPDHVWQDAFPSAITSEQVQIYAEHYGQTPPEDINRVHWWSGFFVAGWTLIGISQNFDLISFLTYFTLSMALCLLTLRTRTLWSAIGMHAGIVFVLLSYGKLADIQSHGFWLGGRNVRDGMLALSLLIALCLVLYLLLRRDQRKRNFLPF